MRIKTILYILLFILFTAHTVFGANYYCDCTVNSGLGSGEAQGTFANPFESINDANDGPSGGWQTGDNLYFLQGSTCQDSEHLNINWRGTDVANPSVIGCYEAENDFICSGARPILDGQTTVPGTTYHGLIDNHSDVGGFITIKDLKVYRSGQTGIYIDYSDNVTVENNYVSYSYKAGIWVGGSTDLLITKNTVTQNGQHNNPTHYTNFGSLVVNGRYSATTGCEISYNKVFNNYTSEGLAIYAGMFGALVQYNVIYDIKGCNVYLYNNTSRDTVIRYNLIYSSHSGVWDNDGIGGGIGLDNEEIESCYTGGSEVYGNLIAAMGNGIYVGCNLADCYQNDILIYDNTIVDCTGYNIRLWPSAGGGSGNLVKNNISWILGGGGAHINGCDRDGWGFDTNNLYGGTLPTGNCETNEVNTLPGLVKESGWDSLVAGGVKGDEFALKPTSLDINTALIIANYNGRIKAADFTASPIEVTTYDDSANPDIGAWAYEGIPVSSSPQPSGTPACSEDPIPLSLQITASKYSDFQWCKDGNGGCDSETVYGGDTMAAFESTGGYLSTHDISEACNQGDVKYWSIGKNHFTSQEQTAPTAHDFNTGGGSAPSTSPPGGGLITLGSGGSGLISIGTYVDGVDIGIIDLM